MRETALLLNPPVPPGVSCLIRDFYCSFSSKAGYYWPPQDLLALSGVLREDFEIRVIDAVASKMSPEACRAKVRESGATVMVFSTGSASLAADMTFVAGLDKRPGDRWFASGSLFRGDPGTWKRRYPFLDGVIADFTEPCALNGSGDERTKAAGDGEFRLGRPLYERFTGRGGAFPFFGGAPFSILVNSFGCSYRCGFCVAGTYRIKHRAMSEVVEDVSRLNRRGIRQIFFVDPLFTADPGRVREFCRAVRGTRTAWVCNAHVDTIQDGTLLEAMRQAGCRALLIGVESGDDALLKRWGKGITIDRIRRAFALCRRHGIETLAYFMIGLPGEDRASARRTIRFAQELRCDYASFDYATPDEGTRLREEALEKGWCGPAGLPEAVDPSRTAVLGTETFSREEAAALLREAYRSFYLRPGYLLRSLGKIRSLGGMSVLVRAGRELFRKNI